ncbi:MAG: formate--tetrahydrofolate ligase, partial [Clostridia bacterium]
DVQDLKHRLAQIQVARTWDGKPVTADELHAAGAMTALLRDALLPNLVQTLEGTPALLHGGPFANIAHGCNTVTATRLGVKLTDYVVTEAGFGADLGAEKFIDIKCRLTGLQPACVVVVATIRALKSHGGVPKAELGIENLAALQTGMSNLMRHLHNIRDVWGLPAVVAVNRFSTDTQAEVEALQTACQEIGVHAALCDVWAQGGAGGKALACAVLDVIEKGDASTFSFTYPDALPLYRKIEAVCKKIYGAQTVVFLKGVRAQLKRLEEEGAGQLPVCIAKTQYSFSDDPKAIGAPNAFDITIRSVKLSRGAGFVVAFAGDIIAMPGLPPVPAAESIDVDAQGDINGLF